MNFKKLRCIFDGLYIFEIMKKLVLAFLAILTIQFGANAQSPLLGDTVILKAQISGDEVQITLDQEALMDTLTALGVIQGRTIGEGVASLLSLWDSVQTVSALNPCGSAVFTSCGNAIGYDCYDYATVQIGSQCWFAENLRSTNYNTGNPMPTKSDADWSSATTAAVTTYDEGGSNESTNLTTYGRLYNGYAVMTGTLCPSGWHVPTNADWTTLTTAVADDGNALKSSATDDPSWDGTNTSGFSAMPGGARLAGDGSFSLGGNTGLYWTSTSHPTNTANAFYRSFTASSSTVDSGDYYQRNGFSVRCVQD